MEIKINHITMAYENSQNSIKQADVKATISITIQSLLVSVGLAGSLLMGTFEKAIALVNKNALKNSYFSFLGIVVCFSIAGIVASVLTYFPIVKPEEETERKREGFLFFEHIKKIGSSSDYLEKVKSVDNAVLFDDLAKQTHAVSKLACIKMNYVKVSVILLIMNLVFCAVLLILSGIIGTIILNGG